MMETDILQPEYEEAEEEPEIFPEFKEEKHEEPEHEEPKDEDIPFGSGKVIYIGPNKPKLGLFYGTVYDVMTYPPFAYDLLKTLPNILRLFVDVWDYEYFSRKCSVKGTVQYKACQEVAEA